MAVSLSWIVGQPQQAREEGDGVRQQEAVHEVRDPTRGGARYQYRRDSAAVPQQPGTVCSMTCRAMEQPRQSSSRSGSASNQAVSSG